MIVFKSNIYFSGVIKILSETFLNIYWVQCFKGWCAFVILTVNSVLIVKLHSLYKIIIYNVFDVPRANTAIALITVVTLIDFVDKFT